MLKRISSYTLMLLSLIILNSCKKEYESVQSIDDRKIEEYISNNNISDAVKDPSGFYYEVLSQGASNLEFFKNTDSVLYSGAIKSLFNGNTYYQSPTVTSNIGTFVGYANQFQGISVPGIRTALQALKPGGKVRLILPSYLAFGKNGADAIDVPSNEIIELTITTYPEQKQYLLDERRILEFITSKGLLPNAVRDESGVYYIVTQQGTGTEPIDLNSNLTVNYTGRLLDGTVFDSNTDGDFSTGLTGVIDGWEILKKFKKGTKVRIFVPSVLAYGTGGSGTILPNSSLDFDLEIVDVVN